MGFIELKDLPELEIAYGIRAYAVTVKSSHTDHSIPVSIDHPNLKIGIIPYS